MHYQTILFDFDGTIADSYEGISRSAQYALEQLGIHVPDRAELRRFIGPTLAYAFSKFYGLNEKESERAVQLYRERYRKTGIYELTLYDGIEEMLHRLKEAGLTLCVASAKPRVFLEQILEHVGLSDFFAVIAGCELDGTRGDKDEVIAYALESLHESAVSSVLMVGDRLHDAEGAAKNGIDFCGVLYGFGSREELSAYHPVYLAASVPDVERFLLPEGSIHG